MRLMYGLNVVLAGVPGLVVLFGPEAAMSGVVQDRVYYGAIGSVWVAIGAVSVFGLRHPLRFAAIFVVQVLYKSLWLAFVLLPLLLAGEIRTDTVALTAVFLLVIAICIVATPWGYTLGGHEGEADR